jgi:hypothetical protein
MMRIQPAISNYSEWPEDFSNFDLFVKNGWEKAKEQWDETLHERAGKPLDLDVSMLPPVVIGVSDERKCSIFFEMPWANPKEKRSYLSIAFLMFKMYDIDRYFICAESKATTFTKEGVAEPKVTSLSMIAVQRRPEIKQTMRSVLLPADAQCIGDGEEPDYSEVGEMAGTMCELLNSRPPFSFNAKELLSEFDLGLDDIIAGQ